MNKIKVLIAEKYPALRVGLKWILEDTGDMEIITSTDDGEEAINQANKLKPDVAIISTNLTTIDGFNVADRIVKESSSTAIIILSDEEKGRQILSCLRIGALGYLVKSSDTNEIVEAVRSVVRGEEVLSSVATTNLIRNLLTAKSSDIGDTFSMLHDREIEILKLIASGLHNKDIANRLIISERTVHTHVSNIFSKLGVKSRMEAVCFALKLGLVSDQDMIKHD
ncbi:LuxR C-terminal-related transcriptional regulator [Chloroflexota bacterium]